MIIGTSHQCVIALYDLLQTPNRLKADFFLVCSNNDRTATSQISYFYCPDPIVIIHVTNMPLRPLQISQISLNGYRLSAG